MPLRKLHSDRLVLRPFEITDAAQLARMTSDPLITRNLLRTTTPFTPDDARRLIMRIGRQKLPVWAIDNGQVIGLIGLAGEFGLWLGRGAWGKGYATEAGSLVVHHAFHTLNMKMLHANPISDNRASHNLLEKLGFRKRGRAHAICRQRGKIVPLHRYELVREPV